MNYFDSCCESWLYFPETMCIVLFLLMAMWIFNFYNRRMTQRWDRDLLTWCCGAWTTASEEDIREKRDVTAEKSKEESEQIKG